MEDENLNQNEKNREMPAECFPDLEDAIKDLPEDTQKSVKKSFSRSIYLSMQSIMPMTNPLYEKIDTNLLGKLIENSESQSVREYVQEKFNKVCGIIIISLVLVTVSVLVYIFREHIADIKDLLMPIIYIAAGGVGGYGVCKAQNKD